MKVSTNRMLIFLLGAWCLAFAVLGFRVYLADSEIWSVTLGSNCEAERMTPALYTRAAFLLPFCGFAHLVQDPVHQLLAARTWHICIALLLIAATALWARREFESPTTGLIAGLLLVLNLGFLNQGFRIRADLLASTIAVCVAAIGVSSKHTLLHAALILLLPAAATPKGLLFGFLAAVARYANHVRPGSLHRSKLIIVLFFLSIWLPLNQDNLRYFWLSISSMITGGSADSGNSFFFVQKFLTRNPLFFSLLALKLFLALKGLRNPTQPPEVRDRERRWLLTSFFWCAAIIVFPDRLPHFMAAGLPFLCIHVASLWTELRGRFEVWRTQATVVALLVLQIQATFFYLENWSGNSNRDQLESIARLDRYFQALGNPTVYDVIGLRPSKTNLRYFLGPHEASVNARLVQQLEAWSPDFILGVRKLGLAGDGMEIYLKRDYLHLGQGVFSKSLRLDEVPFSDKRERFQAMVREQGLEPKSLVSYEVLHLAVGGNRSETRQRTIVELEMMLSPEISSHSASVITKVARFPQPPTILKDLDELFRFDTDF